MTVANKKHPFAERLEDLLAPSSSDALDAETREALEHAHSLVFTINEGPPDDNALTHPLLGLARTLLKRQAPGHAGRLLEAMMEPDSPSAKAGWLVLSAQAQNDLGYPKHALRHGLAALEQYLLLADIAGQLEAHWQVGRSYQAMQCFHEVLEHRFRGLELHAHLGHQNVAMLLSGVAVAYLHIENFNQARRYLEEGLAIARQENDGLAESTLLGNLGNLTEREGNLEEALTFHLRSHHLSLTLNDARDAMLNLGNIAHVFQCLGEREAALDYYRRALDVVAGYPNKGYEGWLCMKMGGLLSESGVAVARTFLDRALHCSEVSGDVEGLDEIFLTLSEHCERQGETAEAFAFYKRYHDAATRFLRESNSKRTEALMVKFNVEKMQHAQEIYRLKNVELAGMVERLETLSFQDGLTGLHNRRYLEAKLERALQDAAPLTILISDIDNFKGVNDTFSHLIGDDVLKVCANIFREHTRGGDVVARYGGEEFLVMLPDTSLGNAKAVAEKIRHKVETYPWHTLHPELHITVSLGLSEKLSADGAGAENVAEFLVRADRKLYQAKRTGKNRIAF